MTSTDSSLGLGPTGESKYQFQFRPEFSRLNQDKDLAWVVPLNVRYIFAVVGLRWAGKTVLMTYLAEKHGFKLYSLSQVLRDIATREGVPIGHRRTLQRFGNSLRADHNDAAYLAYQVMRQIRHDWLGQRAAGMPAPRLAIGGFKNPTELQALLPLRRLHPVVVEADDATREERCGMDDLVPQLTEDEMEAIPTDARFAVVDALDRGQELPSGVSVELEELDIVGEQGQGADAVNEIAWASPRCERLENNELGPRSRGGLYEQADALVSRMDRLYRAGDV